MSDASFSGGKTCVGVKKYDARLTGNFIHEIKCALQIRLPIIKWKVEHFDFYVVR